MLALALCLMMQVQSDYKFERAVELSVMGFVSNQDYHANVPESISAKIDDLGSDCFKHREMASRRLKRIGPPVMRYLYWAENHGDLEIRFRIRTILKNFALCEVCKGDDRQCTPCNHTGYVVHFEDLFNE